jgi:hypothetical protein
MRSAKIEVITGRVTGSTGLPASGKMSSYKISTGHYGLAPPPGKRLLGITAQVVSNAAYGFCQINTFSDKGCNIGTTDVGATVTADRDIMYTAILAA